MALEHWPGPLTLVLRRHVRLPDWVGDGERGTVAVRIPDHPVVLDLLAACESRVRDTAKCLGLSTAHLSKFIRNDPKLWKRVNEMRTAVGAKPLR